MGRPAKIHKKKSFMFTTKHTSFLGVLGIAIAVITIAIVISLVVFSYQHAGDINIKQGSIGFFALLLNIIGVLAGLLTLNERDVYITPGIIAMSANGVMILLWILLLFIAR